MSLMVGTRQVEVIKFVLLAPEHATNQSMLVRYGWYAAY